MPSPRASAGPRGRAGAPGEAETRTRRRLASRPSSARTSADAVWSPPAKPPTPPAGFPPLADDDQPAPRDSSSAPTTKPEPRPRPVLPDVNDAAGGLLALLVWPLVLNYLRHGPAGPKAWLKAKFLNDPTSF
jgi:hypothetical protein